jgi:N-formylmaleamate deformylase
MTMQWDPHSIQIEGATFNYYRTPEANKGKPTLVLQHGFSDNGLCWAPVAEELAAEYDILMPDARGHGRSARVTRGQKIEQAADLAALLNALGLGKVIIAGHSMGAKIASDLAAHYPELVSKVILEDPGWMMPRPDAPQMPRGSMEESPLGQWMIALQKKGLEEILAETRAEHPTWPDAYARPWCQAKLELDLTFLAADNPWGGWQDSIRAIRCPLLVITADPTQGGIVTPEAFKLAKELNPAIREVNFPGVGHHVRFAVHEPYMRAFKAFLQEGA